MENREKMSSADMEMKALNAFVTLVGFTVEPPSKI